MSIESEMSSNHLILCHPVLLLPSISPSIPVFSSESVLLIRWPEYWSFSFSTSPSNEYSGLISFRIDWFDLLAVQGTLKSLLQHHSSISRSQMCGSLDQQHILRPCSSSTGWELNVKSSAICVLTSPPNEADTPQNWRNPALEHKCRCLYPEMSTARPLLGAFHCDKPSYKLTFLEPPCSQMISSLVSIAIIVHIILSSIYHLCLMTTLPLGPETLRPLWWLHFSHPSST